VLHKISFQQIDYFLTVAEVLSFTDAAKLLYISQPALSKQISVLEKELGFPLFQRDRHHVELTPEGASLYQDWNNLSKSFNDSIYNAKVISEQTSGTLSIGCSDTFDYSDILPTTIRKYSQIYPQIDINMESHSFKTLREGLMDEVFDIIFTPYFELDGLPDVHWLKLKDIPLSIIVPTSNPLSQKESLDLDDLKDETIIMISPKDSNSGVERTQALFRRFNFRIQKIRYTPNVSSMGLAVKNGLGIAICNAKRFEYDTINCRVYPLDLIQDDSFLVAVWKKHRKNISLDLFTSLLLEAFPGQIQ
jgi:DNA-binding transcriptional LysR family regulator